jgi:hypothetical protein
MLLRGGSARILAPTIGLEYAEKTDLWSTIVDLQDTEERKPQFAVWTVHKTGP